MINPNLSITTNPNNPYYGNIPGLGTPQLRTAGALGIAPSSVNGSNLYMGLYTLDTLDVTDRLSLTAGARLNFARIQSEDLTGFSPDVTGTHYYNKINPVAGLTYRFSDALNLYGSYSESNRAPTPLELACCQPGPAVPAAELAGGRSAAEAGHRADLRGRLPRPAAEHL